MPTTSQGIYYPDSATNITPLHTVLATMASSIDTILDGDVQVHRVANTTARNALVSQFPPSAANPLFVWRADADNGRELEYTKNGTTWYYYSSSEDTSSATVPLRSGFTHNVTLTVTRDGNTVFLRGRVSGSFTTGNQIIGDIPVGFRPTTTQRPSFTTQTSVGTWASSAITSAGEIYVSTSSAGSIVVNLYDSWTLLS